jgi:hypothetical protein
MMYGYTRELPPDTPFTEATTEYAVSGMEVEKLML